MSPDFFQTVAASVIAGAATGLGTSYLTFRLTFERFKAMDERRELDWVKWRDGISSDVEELKRSANLTQIALLTQSVESLAKRVEDLWKYTADMKHLQVDPYVRAHELLKQRVDKLDRT